MTAAAGLDPYTPTHGSAGYRIDRYELDLDYRVSSNRLAGRARLLGQANAATDRLSLDLAGLSALKVTVNGRKVAKYAQRGDKLHLTLGTGLGEGDALDIQISYAGNPRPLRDTWGEVGWEELSDGVIVAGQPTGAPSWFPCNDHPRDKASFRIAVTTDSPYAVLCNGILTGQTRKASMTTWVFEQREPMATYLATVQIGQYESVPLSSGGVTQRALVGEGLRARVLHDFGRQPEMMRTFVGLFGDYPFADYSVVITTDELEIPLEAQGLSVFGANQVDGRRGEERLVAHELAHQWFGNSLTIDAWEHIWLHEGFACYAEWLWSEHSGGPSADDHAARHWARLARLAQDLIVAAPGPELMFDDRLYKRGALALHALRAEMGDEQFFAMLRSWVRTRRHGRVNTDLFTAHVRGFSGSAADLLSPWLFEAALPPLP